MDDGADPPHDREKTTETRHFHVPSHREFIPRDGINHHDTAVRNAVASMASRADSDEIRYLLGGDDWLSVFSNQLLR